ncbi:MAG: protein-disulfide reductase DsbD family protein [Saprospiraceae bacterium]
MSRLFLSLVLSFVSVFSYAQGPVKWSFEAKCLGEGQYSLIATATIKDGNYTYSQYIVGDDGPLPTNFEYVKGSHYSLVGKNTESGDRVELNDPMFNNMRIVKYKHKFVCTQQVKVTDPTKPITGYVSFISCDERSCQPPRDIDFKYILPSCGVKGQASPTLPATTSDAVNETQPQDASVVITQPITSAIGKKPLPVKWNYEVKKISDTEYDLLFKAAIDKGWSIYSQQKNGDDGPVPTSFQFKENSGIALIGKVEESKNRIEIFDKVFKMKISKFKHDATFSQRIKISDPSQPMEGYLTYMTCDDAQCLPPTDVDFKFDFSGKAQTAVESVSALLTCPPDDPNCQSVFDSKRAGLDKEQFIRQDCGTVQAADNESLWIVFFYSFLGGLVALLTPCVFPMIPLTVSFFTKTAQTRREGVMKALIYGLSIIAIYVFIGLVITGIFGPNVLNKMATNPWMNLAFFLIFIAFSLSFFGFYEITLPSSWSNAADKGADKGGLVGIFFMAFTLALVSFSCTGPIIGSLLVQTSQNVSQTLFGIIPIKPLVGMFGFSFALALPFALFAMFPSWLNSLPKSGGWMESIKVTLGFLELAFALKFLSTADLVAHWGYLRWELFLALWILFAIALAMYQFGVFGFRYGARFMDGFPGILIIIISLALTYYLMGAQEQSFAAANWQKMLGVLVLGLNLLAMAFFAYKLLRRKQHPFKNISKGRWAMGIACTLFASYLCMGFSYKPLSALSGLAPSYTYNFFGPEGCVHGIECFHDFDEAVGYAKKIGKPLFVDFTGYGCVNCRKMEENVWNKPSILKYLKEDYVVVSLYVDDEKRLFPDDKIKYTLDTHTGDKLRTLGSKWASFQINNFGVASQPYYVLMDNDGKTLLTRPTAYTPDVVEYENFLSCGVQAFRDKQK